MKQTDTPGKNLIEVHGLTKRYGSLTALNQISFSVGKGEILGFLGPNGAGKSTTMNILTGCLSATEGSVCICGKNILEQPEAAKQNLGYLPEQPPVYPGMTVNEYLKFVCGLKKVKDKDTQIARAVALCRIGSCANRLIGQLSKGYRQRVGIAQALLGEPPVLILDEPTSGLDPAQIIEIRQLLRSLKGKQTIVLSTHILSEIQAVATRIIILGGGRIIADDTEQNLTRTTGCLCLRADTGQERLMQLLSPLPAALSPLPQQEPGKAEVRIRPRKNADLRREVFALLADAGIPILHLSDERPTLEQVFMNLVQGGGAPETHPNPSSPRPSGDLTEGTLVGKSAPRPTKAHLDKGGRP